MNDLTIKQLSNIIISQAKEKGFGVASEEIDVPEKIALIHSEVSEAFEAYRHKNMDGKDGFHEELIDILIRTIHLCGAFEVDIEKEILKKIDFNKDRKWDWDNMNEKNNL